MANSSSSSNPDSLEIVEILSLNKLSQSLEKLLIGSDSNYNDAEVVVEGISVGIHRYILATRSKFFNDLFKDGKSKYILSDLLPYGNVGYDAFLVFLSYVYTGKLKSCPPEVSTCVNDGCHHDACRPAISFAVELTYASSVFQVPELVSLFQRYLLNFVDKALVEDLIPILSMAFHCQSECVLTRCIDRVARSNLDNISLEKELPFEVAQKVKSLRNSFHGVKSEGPSCKNRIKRIHKALDCCDIGSVQFILRESGITMDEAFALHYVVAYCDMEFAKKVIDLNLANVNLRNSRGYTVLHVAAMRKEPSIIVLLLSKGAAASDTTVDGLNAARICRRLTRPKDYHLNIMLGQEMGKDRVCIDVLEREIERNPMIKHVSVCSSVVADNLNLKIIDLENQVAFARILFPVEAKVAMDIAHSQTILEFPCLVTSKGSNGNFWEMELNDTLLVKNKRLLLRIEALSKTMELGKRFFPHCWEVLRNFMENDIPCSYLENGTPEDQKIMRIYFIKLKEDILRAFTKDKAGLPCSDISSNDMSELYSALSVLCSPTTRRGGKKKLSLLSCFFQ